MSALDAYLRHPDDPITALLVKIRCAEAELGDEDATYEIEVLRGLVTFDLAYKWAENAIDGRHGDDLDIEMEYLWFTNGEAMLDGIVGGREP